MRVVLGGGSACFRGMVQEQRRIVLGVRDCIFSVALTYRQGLEVQREEGSQPYWTIGIVASYESLANNYQDSATSSYFSRVTRREPDSL